MHARRLEGEWLDELPSDDPRARRSRADLRRINAIMGNARMVSDTIRGQMVSDTLVEIGAGDGAFALALARRLKAAGQRAKLVGPHHLHPPETNAGVRDVGPQGVGARGSLCDLPRGAGARG